MRYSIEGDTFPVVICVMEDGEAMLSEGGAMSWMSSNMKMETISNGKTGKVLGRMLSGEGLFLNRYTATNGKGTIAYASSFPGCIRAFEVSPEKEVIAQRSAFLASTPDVEMSVFFQKRLSTGVFGGEGFIMQRLSGNGTVFLEFDGYVKEYELAQGEQMVVDTGYLAAMTAGCKMEIEAVKGMKNKFLGGEGLFNTVITGPGHIWLQSMPISRTARVISRYLPTTSKD
ncbi:MAG: TIGR00266 family protein [Lachnospiraceae bacterium]|nr:TIGR00266 family protein [Lachnospiraceae bacterium]